MSAVALPGAPVATRAKADVATWSDRKLDNAIKRGHTVAGKHMGGYEQAAAVTGVLLLERKRRLPHGKWMPWLEKHFDGSHDVASDYMKMAREISRAGEISGAISKGSAERLVASTENEWHTPRRYIEAARRVLGGIDLDPASSTLANETVGAMMFYSAADDGLAQPWEGRVWCNPPYGRLAGGFIARLLADHAEGQVTAAVALVNAHCTDTAWFQPLWNNVLCFTDHRIDFESAGREKANTSTHGSVFAYLGPDRHQFAAAFSEFGPIVTRWVP